MWFDAILITVLFICVITDVKSRKIYNKVIFPALLIGVLSHMIASGWSGLFFSFKGFLLGLGLLLIPYLLGGMGAGDVKLLALIGALKGSLFVFYTAIYMGLIGGVIALFILLFRKGVITRIKGILYSMGCWKFGMRLPIFIEKEALTQTYPYGLAIAGGAMVCLLMKEVLL
ncbi:prepilin peptidase [Fictibacillus nanhaiensis]|uniref:A24 family peptidase n=1 Tax=Fictibacillus nanhaiensis TaxID=742169 RepID=UPI001C9783A0|nr:prepilin peptidase [Fictibacillus nanhaiensis]MBY6037452.1 prepilin peptidase [Fictibacillus nanhaiensis]